MNVQNVVRSPELRFAKLPTIPPAGPWRMVICTVLAVGGLWPGIAGNTKPLQAATGTPPGTGTRPILVELFTSEGCSSCPPADDFVQKLDALQPVEGAQLIVLSEHVDYWDHEGWKDPNSSHALTQRQGDYEHALKLSTPYTPQIIVDGTTEMRITDVQQVEKVFQQATAVEKVPVRIGSVSIDPGNPELLRAHVETDSNPEKQNAEVYVVIALDHLDSQVLRGENGGKRLTHVAVVQQITKVGKLDRGKAFAEDIQLKLKSGTHLNDIRVVAFAQTPGPGKLLGAVLWKAAP